SGYVGRARSYSSAAWSNVARRSLRSTTDVYPRRVSAGQLTVSCDPGYRVAIAPRRPASVALAGSFLSRASDRSTYRLAERVQVRARGLRLARLAERIRQLQSLRLRAGRRLGQRP